MLQVISDPKVLFGLRDELEDAYSKHKDCSFYSPAFVVTTYEAFLNECPNNDLYFVVNKTKDKIDAYIPLYIDQNKTLRFIFDRHTDYCGVIGEKPDFDFFKDLSKLIIKEPKIRKVDFDNLLPGDALLNYLKLFFGNGVIVSSYNNHSFISTDINKGYFGTLKSKYRSELKRVQNKNEGFAFKAIDFPQSFPKQAIVSLRNKMIEKGWRDKSFYDDKFIELSEKLYESKQLILISKWDNDDLLSLVLVFRNNYQKLFTFWMTLFDEKVQYINLSTYLDFITSIEKNDEYSFSFGRGDYDFKSKFCPTIENLYNLRFSKSKFDFLFANYYPVKQFIKRMVKN